MNQEEAEVADDVEGAEDGDGQHEPKSCSSSDEHEWLSVEAAFWDAEEGEHVFRVIWAEGGTNDEREASTQTFPMITHSEMELEGELNDRVIRVF